MSGKGNLRITVVGTDTDDLTRIAQGITSLGIEIDDEDLVHREYFRPYALFGPRDEEGASPVSHSIDPRRDWRGSLRRLVTAPSAIVVFDCLVGSSDGIDDWW
jgi:hypothetical protein